MSHICYNTVTLKEGVQMTEKKEYKSLRVPVKLHANIKAEADKKYMSIISYLQYLIDSKGK
jgi:hypothetical protein